MAKQLSNRLDRLENAVSIQHYPSQVVIRRFSGDEGRKIERKYLLTQARASLGLCEPDQTIFLSKRTKLLKEECPGFPMRIPREYATQLIKEHENGAA